MLREQYRVPDDILGRHLRAIRSFLPLFFRVVVDRRVVKVHVPIHHFEFDFLPVALLAVFSTTVYHTLRSDQTQW